MAARAWPLSAKLAAMNLCSNAFKNNCLVNSHLFQILAFYIVEYVQFWKHYKL